MNVFVFADVDNLQKHIDFFLLEERFAELRVFSEKIEKSLRLILSKAISDLDAEIVFIGGDDILFRATYNDRIFDRINSYKREFFDLTGVKISFGVGKDIQACIIDLKKKKALELRIDI